ncbi:OmpA family protein [Thiomicrospira microaerophila]|uniref:OmpA family protein n=1 Tax=Thiomicrospira microaerophila TaxID=406020 RepID=UPI0005C85036|nr:OmpA family protein [Thiomicrospira microaerophila]
MRNHHTEENYFVSMTDMMVGVLFIFIIMVAFFAFQIQTEDSIPKPVHEKKVQELNVEITSLETLIKELRKKIIELEAEVQRLLNLLSVANEYEKYSIESTKTRETVILSIQSRLKEQGIDASANVAQGVITIPGDTLFASASSDLGQLPTAYDRIKKLSQVLGEEISCFVLVDQSKHIAKACNPSGTLIETIFIEGHTDSFPVSRVLSDGSKNNLELSARRATNSYEAMINFQPSLITYKNPFAQQVLSVSAFGEQRPLATNATREGREQNRRIDIRFLMYMPSNQTELESFKEEFGIE